MTREKLDFIMKLKNAFRGRVQEYADKYPEATYTATESENEGNRPWSHKTDCAFPSATQNEINAIDAQNLLKNGTMLVCEGANMPTTD